MDEVKIQKSVHSQELTIVWALFFFSVLVDLGSTAFVLTHSTDVRELSPIVSDTTPNTLGKLARVDLLIVIAVSVIFGALVVGVSKIGKSTILREFSELVLRATFIVAVAKIWFSIENMQLYFFRGNVATTVQSVLERYSIADIDSREKAFFVSLVLAGVVATGIYLRFFARLRERGNFS